MGRATSLVTQWIRIRLPAQGTQVWSVVHEDPTRCEAAKPESHNSQARPLKLLSLCPTTTEAWMPRARTLQEKLLQWEGLCTEMRSSSPLATTRESPRKARKTQHSQRWMRSLKWTEDLHRDVPK